MDYKYIEQLLERYWEGETTLQEEAILRTFFSQDDVPANLMKYKSLFDCGLQEETLGDDFDARILESIGDDEPKAKIVTLTSRLKPLFKAAAIVAIIGALQIHFKMNSGEGDVTKSIMMLGGACLFMIGAYILFPAFFGYNII